MTGYNGGVVYLGPLTTSVTANFIDTTFSEIIGYTRGTFLFLEGDASPNINFNI